MSKKVLATNCTIQTLPKDWSAKINDNGVAIITVPECFAEFLEVKFVP